MFRILMLVVPLVLAAHLYNEDGERKKRASYHCSVLIGHHCFGEPYDPQCGTNNFTYYNKCDFSKNHCRASTIHLAHSGTCHGESQSGNLTHGEYIVLEFACDRLLLKGCPDEFAQICASNGVTYLNECEYELARCLHPDMHIIKRSPCVA